MKKIKKTKILSTLICTAFICANTPAVFANNNQINTDETIIKTVNAENNADINLNPHSCSMNEEEYREYRLQGYKTESIDLSDDINKIMALNDDNDTKSNINTDSGKCGDNVEYYFENNILTLKLIDADNKNGSTYSYSAISKSPWYNYRELIKEIVVENGVTELKEQCFANCINLAKITLPETLTYIGNYTFLNTSLPEITIPGSVKVIDQYAFLLCQNLFYINLENGVRDISMNAFAYCNIESIYIPESVEILWLPFNFCYNLKNINVDINNKYYSSDINGILYNKDKTELKFCPINCNMSELTVNSSITKIDDLAFENNKNITKINSISENCTFGKNVFKDSDFILNHLWNNGSYCNKDEYDNEYLIINGVLFDVNPKDKDNFILNLNNTSEVKRIAYCGTSDIKKIVLKDIIDIDEGCLDKTSWFESTNNGKKMINLIKNGKEMSLLYKYIVDDSNISETINVNLTNCAGIYSNAFGGNKNKTFNIKLNSNMQYISPDAFRDANSIKDINISNITVDDKPINVEYLDLRDSIIYKNKDGAFIQKTEENRFIYDLAFAVTKNKNYFDKLAIEYCRKIVKEWNLDENLPTSLKIRMVSYWIEQNCKYGLVLEENDSGVYEDNNNTHYSETSLNYNAGGHLLVGYGLCMSYSYLFNNFMNAMEINCINVTNGGIEIDGAIGNHMWNAVKTEAGWYYYDGTGSFLLRGQKNMVYSEYVGYRNEDKYTYSYINDLNNKIKLIDESNDSQISEENFSNPIYKINIKKFLSSKIGNLCIENNNYIQSCYINGLETIEEHFILVNNEVTNPADKKLVLKDENNNIIFENNFGDNLSGNANINGTLINYQIEYDINAKSINIIVYDCEKRDCIIKFNDYAGIQPKQLSVLGQYGDFNFSYSNDPNEEYFYVKDILGPFTLTFYNNLQNEIITVSDPFFEEKFGYIPDTEYAYYLIPSFEEDEETKQIKVIINFDIYSMGDITQNGIVDVNDVDMLTNYLLGKYQFIQTGSTGNLTIGNKNLTINGDIAANGVFDIIADNANINGTLSAKTVDISKCKNINFNRPLGNNFINDDLLESVLSKEKIIKNYFSSENTMIYDRNDEGIIAELYLFNDVQGIDELINPIYVKNGTVNFIGSFNIKNHVASYGNMNFEETDCINIIDSILYSETGNININANNVSVNGFIYAPNGKVTITGNNVNITGTIIANEIEILSNNSMNFNITQMNILNGLVDNLTFSAFQELLADMDKNNKLNIFDLIALKRKLINLESAQ